jgi:hypothetical protein
VSAMGERFLILEDTADALDVIDPELAVHFRTVNGLPKRARDEMTDWSIGAAPEPPVAPSRHHEIRMDVGDDHIRSDCSCGEWSNSVGWDEIDVMVAHVRDHVGSAQASSGNGIATRTPSTSPAAADKRVG